MKARLRTHAKANIVGYIALFIALGAGAYAAGHDALERAGLRRLRFHDLRHAFGSAAITKLDAHAVQSYMGHQHYSTTQRYLHHKPRRDDAAKLAEAFESEGGASIGHQTERNSDQLRPRTHA
jgi:integrase